MMTSYLLLQALIQILVDRNVETYLNLYLFWTTHFYNIETRKNVCVMFGYYYSNDELKDVKKINTINLHIFL